MTDRYNLHIFTIDISKKDMNKFQVDSRIGKILFYMHLNSTLIINKYVCGLQKYNRTKSYSPSCNLTYMRMLTLMNIWKRCYKYFILYMIISCNILTRILISLLIVTLCQHTVYESWIILWLRTTKFKIVNISKAIIKDREPFGKKTDESSEKSD